LGMVAFVAPAPNINKCGRFFVDSIILCLLGLLISFTRYRCI
jgi:hypothetical protein